ncbi:Uu.00g006850.m01.CDS01 [Anthostomella pinea]|uniref:tRNA-intron lyase n=1 Tax=Anthostomella pinea TaxID=933095 RepID=A0AAI8YJ11_9PEZI|nr:Uu.00g006850.m01.CDS01 [Anthostomella pinea]
MTDITKPNLPQADAAVLASDKPVDPEVKQDVRPLVPRGPPMHQIYALPAPIRTFPLPNFYPSNPLSLLHLIYAWVRQTVSPPRHEPAVVHQGIWSPNTRSVHIKDPKSIRALWEQGFFGKGLYSRSEPNWLKREQARQGKHEDHVAELYTTQRREERKLMKWERARKEQEAISRTRLQEAWVGPVGPKELLALPNSQRDLQLTSLIDLPDEDEGILASGPTNLTSANGDKSEGRPNGILMPSSPLPDVNGGSMIESETSTFPTLNGVHTGPSPTVSGAYTPKASPGCSTVATKRRKSVRFSPKVESTTFHLSDPPSPGQGLQPNGKVPNGSITNGNSPLSQAVADAIHTDSLEDEVFGNNSDLAIEIVDREHLQLTLEEAFYLVFALGVLTIMNPVTGKSMTAPELFTLCRQQSYFPPRSMGLQPDDPFLIQYAVYHHFRSLGWVVRPGIKFGVDWLLYNRGPVFSHAEFAVMVLPAYTHDWWKAEGRRPPQKSWHWLHSINRVQSTALKTLVLVYVDIPPRCDEELEPATILKQYRVREFIVKRWLSNRNRD